MWWRIVVFCFLVSFILFIVLNYLHDRPVVHLFFKRCCEDGIENDNVVFETFKDNYLKERLIALELVDVNGTFVPEDANIEEMIELMREKLNVHDPHSRRTIELFEEEFISTSDKNEVKHKGFIEIIETEKEIFDEVTSKKNLKNVKEKELVIDKVDVSERINDAETLSSDFKNQTSNEINP